MSKFSMHNKGLAELQSRVLFVLTGILVFRIGVHLPIPGVDLQQITNIFQQNQGNMVLGYFDLFSGGAAGGEAIESLPLGDLELQIIDSQSLWNDNPDLEGLYAISINLWLSE